MISRMIVRDCVRACGPLKLYLCFLKKQLNNIVQLQQKSTFRDICDCPYIICLGL